MSDKFHWKFEQHQVISWKMFLFIMSGGISRQEFGEKKVGEIWGKEKWRKEFGEKKSG